MAYENTAVISEAVLLGTPVVLERSAFFPALLADAELGTSGTAWTTDDSPLQSALSTLGEARHDYELALELTKADVDAFRLEMRERALAHRFRTPLDFNWRAALPRASWKARLSYARDLQEQGGAKALSAAMLNSLARRLGNRGPMT